MCAFGKAMWFISASAGGPSRQVWAHAHTTAGTWCSRHLGTEKYMAVSAYGQNELENISILDIGTNPVLLATNSQMWKVMWSPTSVGFITWEPWMSAKFLSNPSDSHWDITVVERAIRWQANVAVSTAVPLARLKSLWPAHKREMLFFEEILLPPCFHCNVQNKTHSTICWACFLIIYFRNGESFSYGHFLPTSSRQSGKKYKPMPLVLCYKDTDRQLQ